jgi:probable HAF family extracellular repeat protein
LIKSIFTKCFLLGLAGQFAWLSVPGQTVSGAGFIGLGDLPGGGVSSTPFAIPVDSKAQVVVGISSSAQGSEAFYWTPEHGMVGLGDLPGGDFYSGAFGVSMDGSVVVGASKSAMGSEAFRHQAGQMTGLGDLPGGDFMSGAWDVSPDGSVIVGGGSSVESSAASQSHQNYREAFRWEAGQMSRLGELPGGVFHSRATGISNDGLVVVGSSSPASQDEAFRYQAGQMTGLGDLPGGHVPRSGAWATSADGSVVVGYGTSELGLEAFRWEGGQMTGLGDLPDGVFSSIAYSVSGDGSVIVGTASSAASDRLHNEAFIWNPVNGMLPLKNVLEDHMGFDLAGWTLLSARDISFDSRVITGEGINPQGQREAWLVQSWGQPFGPISDPGVYVVDPYPFPNLPPFPDPFPITGFPFVDLSETHLWTSGGNGLWGEASNWDGGKIVPQANWDVQLDNQKMVEGQAVVVGANSVVQSIDLSGTAGPMYLIIKDNVKLTVLEGITVGPGGILKGAGTVLGDITNLGGTVAIGFPEPSGSALLALGLLGLGCWFPGRATGL